MGNRKRGPISKEIKCLCYELSNNKINENNFKEGIQKIINDYGETGYILQGIGMAVQKWCGDNKQIWKLIDEVDIRIRKQFENWLKKMMV